ncbi:hypothetical protein SFRURICE_005606 [Spodoptera frugiperda]|nr:hypothetical protein SFRURICE_005606 [Spodoptera frugiperda]
MNNCLGSRNEINEKKIKRKIKRNVLVTILFRKQLLRTGLSNHFPNRCYSCKPGSTVDTTMKTPNYRCSVRLWDMNNCLGSRNAINQKK